MQVEEIKIERKETFVRILLSLFFKDKCPERIGHEERDVTEKMRGLRSRGN